MQFTVTIPKDWELMVKEGDTVDFSTPLVNNAIAKQASIPLAQIVGISPKKIFNTLKKFVGDHVKKGDIIAQNKKMMFSKKYKSEYDGILKEVNHNDGHIVIEYKTEEKTSIDSFFKGTIEKIAEESQIYTAISIKAEEVKEYELKEVHDYIGGDAVYLDSTTINSVTEDGICEKVVFINSLRSYDQTKLEALGAKALIMMHSPPDKTHTPIAKLTKIEDWNDITAAKLPYCTVDRQKGTIFFYK